MRALMKMDTIQIEVTNACVLACGNCTRMVGHKKPFFMEWETFTRAVDSMVGFPHMTGIMGGEPLLHPRFPDMCDYALRVLGREHLGLWTTLPEKYAHYREVICRTFRSIFLNDHTRGDIFHAPLLVAAEDVYPNDPGTMWNVIEECWIQMYWSASINPRGAYFCEVAAALSLLFNGPEGWPVEPGWWKRVPKDFTSQQEWACPKCGGAVSLPRRKSVDERDDVSPSNRARLEAIHSYRERRGQLVDSPLKVIANPEPMAAYKDFQWRQKIAARYGMRLAVNDLGFNEPFLSDGNGGAVEPVRSSLFDEYVRTYGGNARSGESA